MAARRLIIIMLILLGVSTLAAALVPTRAERDDEETTSTAVSTAETETFPEENVPNGKPLELTIVLEKGDDRVRVVPMELGDQLELRIKSDVPDQLEIPALGLVETVGPDLPARFEVFADRVGDYGVRSTENNRVVARIEVSKPKPKPKPEKKPKKKTKPA